MSQSSNNSAVKHKVPDKQSLPKKSSKKTKQKRSANSERCVSCDKETEDNAVICQWCSKWKHRMCAGINVNEYNMLSTSSNKIMFSCTLCYSKIPFALKIEDEISTKNQDQ